MLPLPRRLSPLLPLRRRLLPSSPRLSLSLSLSPFRPLSSSTPLHSGGGAQGDEPGGWLWGIPPGEKYEKEGWENPMFYGYCGSIAVFVVLYAYKPDTTLGTWANEEARRRLEKEGLLEDPDDFNPIVGPYPNKERYHELVLGRK